jgi:hypothetical protein
MTTPLIAIPTANGLAYIDPTQVFLVMDTTPDWCTIQAHGNVFISTPLASESVIRLLFPEPIPAATAGQC